MGISEEHGRGDTEVDPGLQVRKHHTYLPQLRRGESLVFLAGCPSCCLTWGRGNSLAGPAGSGPPLYCTALRSSSRTLRVKEQSRGVRTYYPFTAERGSEE